MKSFGHPKKRKNFFIISTFFLFLISVLNLSFAEQKSEIEKDNLPRLLFFYSESCHACQKTKKEVMPRIEEEFKDRFRFEYLNIANEENYRLLLSLQKTYQKSDIGVPTVFIEGSFLFGYEKIKNELRNVMLEALKKKRLHHLGNIPIINLVEHFRSFSPLAILIAGLVDGINPCAFTVIVFFISFLALQGYKKKELAIVGLAFIVAVFLTYVLIGLGLFRFLYSFAHFYWITKTMYFLIALLCIALGFFALYDFWFYLKTRNTEGMTLQLPQVIKNKIHSIIGLYYRRKNSKQQGGDSKCTYSYLVASAFSVGFFISLLEAVCTGQLYLPTIAFVLKEPSLRTRALWFLVLYNLMFIVPLFVVLFLALLGTTSQKFASFLKKHMLIIKFLMAVLFFSLGAIIFFGA